MIESIKAKAIDKWNSMGWKTKAIGAAVVVIIIIAIIT
tara:strand:- start:14 stop:127 length:114 start_codon:yes stop_codon:yes gene_type:complete